MASTKPYIDVLYKDKYNVPSIPPNYLIAVISMIIRSQESEDIKNIIQLDPLLTKVLFSDSTPSSKESNYDKELIVLLVHIIQQAYGIDFQGFGPFSRGFSLNRESYEELLFQSLSLIWNYSPVVSEEGTLNIINDDVDIINDDVDA